jgi:adenylate cyclase
MASRTIVRWSYRLTVVATIVAVVLIGLAKARFAPELSNLVFDLHQRLDPIAWDPEAPVRILDIDDDSLARIGQWPWPRSTIAEMVTRLGGLGAAVVAVDILFAEPDGSSPERLVARLPPSPGRTLLTQEASERTSNDALLAQAIGKTPTVLGAILTQDGAAVDFPTKFGLVTAGDDPRPFIAHFTSAVVPLAELSAAAAGLGALNWLPDRDQIVRRVPLIAALDHSGDSRVRAHSASEDARERADDTRPEPGSSARDAAGEQIVPGLAAEALRLAQGASTIIVRSSNASGQTAFGAQTGVNAIKIGDLEIPTDPEGALRVNYSHSEPRRFIPAWKLLAGEVERGEIENRIIVIGTSAAGLRDQRSTPVDTSITGVEIHAQVLEHIISGAWLQRPDWSQGAELMLALLLALAFGMMLPRITALSGAMAAIIAVGLVAWASRYGFTAHGLLLDPMLPIFSVGATYVACVVWLYRTEQRRRRFVHEAFGRYVSPAVVERLAQDPSRFVLGGELRHLTIMFCDIRGFTSIAERLDAQGLTRFMNEYLTAMTDAILAHGGTVDKYIGDGIMAFWNAPLDDPDYARNAVRAAIAMTRELEVLNDNWKRSAEARGEEYRQVGFRIGLATGECSVGNFGSTHRFNYSVIGDDVNLASRLEGTSKLYRTTILASEATRDLLPELAWLEVDSVRVKGRTGISRIFTLAERDIEPASPGFVALGEVHERMLAAYRCGDFEAAGSHARQAHDVASPWVRELYVFYEARCRELGRSRPDNWVPVTDLEKL